MSNKPLKAILLLAAALRVALLVAAWNCPDQLATPDSAGYIELSETLLDRGAFVRNELPEIFRTPGYPVLLAAGAPFGESGWRVTTLFQIFVDVLLVYLTFLLGSLICDRQTGMWAAALQAVAATALAASLRTLSDGVFAFLMTLSVLLLAHHFRFSQWWSLLSAAGVAAASCYVRPVGIMFCAVVVVVLLPRKGHFRRAGAFAGVVLLVLAPWVIRNKVTADYTGFSSFAGDSLYLFAAPQVIAETSDMTAQEARQKARFEDNYAQELSLGERTSGQGARQRRTAVMRTMADNPGAYIRIHLTGCGSFFLPAAGDVLEIAGVTTGQKGTLDVLHEEGFSAALRHYFGGKTWAIWLCGPMLAILVAKYMLAVECLCRRLSAGMGASAWLMVLVFVVFALSGGPASTPRFRVPVEPILSVAAAAGIVTITDRLKRRKEKRSGIA